MCVYEIVFYEGGNITLRVFVRARNSHQAVVHTLNEVGYTCEFDRVMVTSMTDAVLIDTVANLMCVYEIVFYADGNITLRVFVKARNSHQAVVHTLNEVGYTCDFDRVMVTSMTDAVLIDTVADK